MRVERGNVKSLSMVPRVCTTLKFGGGADFVEVTIEGTNWEYTSELALLDEAMEMTTQVFRGEETKKMINAIDVSFYDVRGRMVS
jgi:hypothetical protein